MDKKPDAKTTVADGAKKDSESKPVPLPPIKTAEQRLRDQIRDEIAQEKLQDQLAKIQALLAKWRSEEWVPYDTAKDKSAAQKPTPPDFAALAKQYMMSAGRTGLVSRIDLRDLDLGKSEEFDAIRRSANLQQPMSVIQLMFGATTLYKPDVSGYLKRFPDVKRIYFVFWKIDDQPDHIPKWEDPGIQAEVLRVWRLNEARTLALKRADELKAEAAAKSGKSLKELAAGKKKDFTVLKPPPFTFLTTFGGLHLSDVGDLDKLGLDFMKKVFSLAPNQVDVATNLPKTEIYVIRAVEFTPFKELWSNFTSDADDWSLYTTLFSPNGPSERTVGLIQLMREDQGTVSQAWLEKVKADAGFEWEKPAESERSAPGQQSPGPSPGDEE